MRDSSAKGEKENNLIEICAVRKNCTTFCSPQCQFAWAERVSEAAAKSALFAAVLGVGFFSSFFKPLHFVSTVNEQRRRARSSR